MSPSEAIRKLYEAGKLHRPYHPGMLYWREPGELPERLDERCPNVDELLTWEPVLLDHATRGCLLELLREASGRQIAYAYKPSTAWVICDHPGNPALGTGWTEGEAIAAALVRLAEGM